MIKETCIKKDSEIKFTNSKITLNPLIRCEPSLYIFRYLSETINRIKSWNRASKIDFANTTKANAATKTTVAQSLFSIIRGCNSSTIICSKFTKIYFFTSIIILLRCQTDKLSIFAMNHSLIYELRHSNYSNL